MKRKKIIKNRKGLSPMFVSLYMAILAILLISLLFIALDISNSALAERMRIEQERMQESIALTGPEALNLTQGSIVESLRIDNTGSITVRIRSLYIDHKFICDPSEFEGDAYVEPRESLWIQLYPIVKIIFNDTTANAYWTVTTERGTKASELGKKLKGWDPEFPYTPNKFYFGPLMLIFDEFHWSTELDVWRDGWSIPKGTKDVTWHIRLVNIDDRDINITDTSCFTLISNDNSPKDPVPWYIDPMLSETFFEPGVLYDVYYTWNKPFSKSGASRQDVSMKESTTCINFLTFFGYFVEENGTYTPFGQTVPFEAVLITTESMAASVELTSNPQNIKNDGFSSSTITATVKDNIGNPVAEGWVEFYTTAGVLSTTSAKTDANGVATITLTSSTSQRTAYVTALCQSVEGTCDVVFTPASQIEVNAFPNPIPKDGGASQITAQLKDENNQTVSQSGITITFEIVSWDGPAGKKPTLTHEDQSGYSLAVVTDSNGQVTITLTARGATGTANVTASTSGMLSEFVEVNVT